MLAPSVALGFEKFTVFNRLENSERNCSRTLLTSGDTESLKDAGVRDRGSRTDQRITARVAVRPCKRRGEGGGVEPLLDFGGCRTASRQNTGLPTTLGRWLGSPLNALSAPVSTLIGIPDRSDTKPFNCHPPGHKAQRRMIPTLRRGRSQIQEKEAMCFAKKSRKAPHSLCKLKTFGTEVPSAKPRKIIE